MAPKLELKVTALKSRLPINWTCSGQVFSVHMCVSITRPGAYWQESRSYLYVDGGSNAWEAELRSICKLSMI